MAAKYAKKRSGRRIVIWSVTLLLLLGLIAAGVWGFLLPYLRAESFMKTDEDLLLQHQSDGGISLTWPAAEKTDYYLVEVLLPVEAENKKGEPETVMQAIYSEEVRDGVSCVLRNLPLGEDLTLRINTMVCYENLDKTRVRPGEMPLEVTMQLAPPRAEDVQWEADPQADTIGITFTMEEGDRSRLWYHTGDENWQLLKTLREGQTVVSFAFDGDLPLPQHGEEYFFRLDSYREQPGSVYYSCTSEPFRIIREDLLDRDLWVQLTDQGDNVATLVWNETKGEYYEVQMKAQGEEHWSTVLTVEQNGDRSFTTGHLDAFKSYSFRVIAWGGQTEEGTPAATSEQATFQTRESVLYSTIWPLINLKVYANPDLTEELGKVEAGKAYCVVENHEKSFGIRFSPEVTGYIDNRYVMIDLVEYMGDLCAYNITNSYSSKYMVHEYDMEDITGEITTGYERVRMYDGTYLVPLLYPVAQRLLTAAHSAREEGYRLKIYDSFRPQKATSMLYKAAEEMLKEPVPGNIPSPTEEDPNRLLTFGIVMTDDGKYPLNYFLARGASRHNLGVALDLTIETWDGRQEKPMQTEIHDLSYYSLRSRNNSNAKVLRKIMEGAGFAGLVSEWWHFQDDEAYSQLKPSPLYGGVTPEGWKLSDRGWRYRLRDGSYAVGSREIDGVTYVFNDVGYLTE